jgi:hypothetical protein
MPVILATWEAEMRKNMFQGQQAKSQFDPLMLTNSWVWWLTPVIPNYIGGCDWEDCGSMTTSARACETPSQWKKLGVVVHVYHPISDRSIKISRLAWKKARAYL